ncbi:MAG: hypothetical protein K8H88_30335 [Sandaracinaceae bacterium]|nr:hypothetical protein [Sandaracinaceae bacterium]
MTRARHATWTLLVAAALLLWPTAAHAHPRGTLFRLGLGIPALGVTHFPSPDSTSVTYALSPVTFGVHMGVQVVSEVGLSVVVLGGGRYDNVRGADTHQVFFSVAPRFEYMFTPHGTVGFYLGGNVGFDISGDPDANLRDVFHTGPFAGMHIFPDAEFSVDLELAPSFLYDFDLGAAGFRSLLYISVTGWLR